MSNLGTYANRLYLISDRLRRNCCCDGTGPPPPGTCCTYDRFGFGCDDPLECPCYCQQSVREDFFTFDPNQTPEKGWCVPDRDFATCEEFLYNRCHPIDSDENTCCVIDQIESYPRLLGVVRLSPPGIPNDIPFQIDEPLCVSLPTAIRVNSFYNDLLNQPSYMNVDTEFMCQWSVGSIVYNTAALGIYNCIDSGKIYGLALSISIEVDIWDYAVRDSDSGCSDPNEFYYYSSLANIGQGATGCFGFPDDIHYCSCEFHIAAIRVRITGYWDEIACESDSDACVTGPGGPLDIDIEYTAGYSGGSGFPGDIDSNPDLQNPIIAPDFSLFINPIATQYPGFESCCQD